MASGHFVSVAGQGGSIDAYIRDHVVKGKRLTPEEIAAFPTQAIVGDPVREIVRDFHMMTPCWAVCEAFRDMVESLEPGVHQFMPIEFVNRKGEPFSKRFFQMHILSSADAVDVEQSDAYWREEKLPDGTPAGRILSETSIEPHFTLYRKRIERLHVWRESKFLTARVFFSDPLMERVKVAGLKGLQSFKAREV